MKYIHDIAKWKAGLKLWRAANGIIGEIQVLFLASVSMSNNPLR